MILKNKAVYAILYTSLMIFLGFVIYIITINQEVFYTAHNHSEFLYGSPFFQTMLSVPFGLMQYVGAWLTQYFYYPAVGGSMLIVIWLMIFLTGRQAFRLHGSSSALMLLPVACLLTSVSDIGYWVYLMSIRGYWFSQSVSYLIVMILLCLARLSSRKWHLVWYILGVCLYPVLGWYAMLFVLCLALTEKPGWRELLGLLSLLITANVWHALLYQHLCLDDVMMAGLPRFLNPTDDTPHLTTPFWLLGGSSLLLSLFSRYLDRWYVPVVSALVGIVLTWSFSFTNRNYTDEMRMVRSAESDNWEEVLQIFKETPQPTGSMIMLKNVALMNSGGLLNESFKLGNNGESIYNPDSIHVSFLEIAAPLIYYNYGMQNEAIRLSYECAVQAGFSPFYLKILARCTQATGEENLMRRFLTMLHHHPYYADWHPAPVSAQVSELQNAYHDEILGVENSAVYLAQNICLWYESDSKLASEQALFYSMIRSDSRLFWKALRQYFKLHLNESFPDHAQEAYIMYMDKAPEEKRMMLPVSEDIYNRYKKFWTVLSNHIKCGYNQQKVAELMRAEFGDTYWYYNVFGRKI